MRRTSSRLWAFAPLISLAAWAQEAPPPDGAPAQAPKASTPAAPKGPTGKAPEATLKAVEIRANQESDTRRLSTAAKIVVGREEIERYGDTSMGELLKRLPGVVSGGRPGRGGPPQMRGLGGGYTQILIDGERAPRGFSLEDLAPEQVERVEIYRAPTAETGARAIAGTINIITRGGYIKYLNNLSVGAGLENGKTSPGLSWTRSDTTAEGLSYTLSVSAMRMDRSNDDAKSTRTESLLNPAAPVLLQTMDERTVADSQRDMMHLNGRLQWGAPGADTLMLMPMLIMSQGGGTSSSVLSQSGGDLPYATSASNTDSRFATLRLAGSWSHRLDNGARLQVNANGGNSQWNNSALRQQNGGTSGGVAIGPITSSQSSTQKETSVSGNGKYSQLIADKHSLVAGLELEASQRDENASTLRNGESPLSDFDGNLSAASRRVAVYAQNEWEPNPHWAAHAGLRLENIRTSGSVAVDAPTVSNESSVLTPLLHAVWRPDLAAKDQFRASLTRSYRSPDLARLIARPTINSFYLNRGSNTELHPDSAGNPDLMPELAVGLDVAFEHYLSGGGLLSANVFVRKIDNLMRNRVALESVSWADAPRWVSRMQNIGNAITSGVELEAKFRLREIDPEAPALDIRANMSIFRSQVLDVPGPNNRLEQQADGVLNLGADYRLSSMPLRLSGNINWTPGFSTRLSDAKEVFQGDKLVADASALWIFNPSLQLRLSASNFLPRKYPTGGTVLSNTLAGLPTRDMTLNNPPSYVNYQARLELKL